LPRDFLSKAHPLHHTVFGLNAHVVSTDLKNNNRLSIKVSMILRRGTVVK